MKKISAAFDGLKFSSGTMEYAIQLATDSQALLSGIFLDDFTYHSYKLYDMVGSQGVSREKMKQLMDKDKKTRLDSVESFEASCKQVHIDYVVHHDKSIAQQELLRESIYSDMLVIGANETFTHFEEAPPTQFIKDLLSDVQCPVMIVPPEFKKPLKVVMLYDGKPSSVFSMKMFNYLMTWMRTVDTEIISVIDPKDNGELSDSALIREFVNCHYPYATYTLLHGDPEEEIVRYLKGVQQDVLVVLGAYRRGTVSMWFKKSMADILMKEVSLPLFIAHNK